MSEATPFDTRESLSSSMQFGMFMAPFHPPKSNPTLDYERDLDLVEWLDTLGFDEALFGEHHSGGYETFGCPELMIATAAQRTRRIRLGTGVVSVAYHNPFLVAERIVMLDHLTRGRVMLGLGPGALPSDTAMFGIDYGEIRNRLEQGTEAIMHLLTREEPLTMDAGWFKLNDARLNLKPYTRPHPPVAVAALLTPSGPRVAGRFGLPLLSLAATSPMFRDVLAEHWQIMEERADEFGVARPTRRDWRLVGPMHLAETREQAERDVEYGIQAWADYFFRDAAAFEALKGGLVERPGMSLADVIRESGMGVVGTPDDAIELIEGLQETSGGFGSYLILHHEWANAAATKRSYELFAHHVMPHFQDAGRRQERWDHMRVHIHEQSDAMVRGMDKARAEHEAEKAAKSASRA